MMLATIEQAQRLYELWDKASGDHIKFMKDALDKFFREAFADEPPAQQRDYRKEIWISAWNSGTPMSSKACTQWADQALAEFDKKFPQE